MKALSEIMKSYNLDITSKGADGFMGYILLPGLVRGAFVFSYGGGWEHLSVSLPNRTPTWEEMCVAKDIFFNNTETCVEYHPAKADYVNNVSTCLHIWRPIGIELPKPPAEMVGVKGVRLR